jgi:CBS domain-containing protein
VPLVRLPQGLRVPAEVQAAREIMSTGVGCVAESASVLDVATLMASERMGAVPVCGEDGRLKGMVTDRDIVVKVLAEGKDPRALHASEPAQTEAVTIGADDDAEESCAPWRATGSGVFR